MVYEQNICVVRKNLVLRIKVVFKVERDSDPKGIIDVSLYLDSDLSVGSPELGLAQLQQTIVLKSGVFIYTL